MVNWYTMYTTLITKLEFYNQGSPTIDFIIMIYRSILNAVLNHTLRRVTMLPWQVISKNWLDQVISCDMTIKWSMYNFSLGFKVQGKGSTDQACIYYHPTPQRMCILEQTYSIRKFQIVLTSQQSFVCKIPLLARALCLKAAARPSALDIRCIPLQQTRANNGIQRISTSARDDRVSCI